MTRSLALAAFLIAPMSALAATGGPDSAGYLWADSAEPFVTTTVPAYTQSVDMVALGLVGDESVVQVPLPASVFPTGFPYYGQNYSNIFVSSNGWLSFVDPGGASVNTPTSVPSPGAPDGAILAFWDNWTVDIPSPVDNAGPNNANDGFTLQLRVAATPTSAVGQILITLYTNGSIKLLYFGAAPTMRTVRTTVGIENETGTIGLAYMSNGVPQSGAQFANNYAVQFFPKGKLDCTNNIGTLSCPTVALAANNLAGGNLVDKYNCATGTYAGHEKVFTLTVNRFVDMTLTLNNTDGLSRDMFLMRPGCNEQWGCITGGATVLNPSFVAPGTYNVVVDGVAGTDNGNFTIDVSCQNVTTPVNCFTSLPGESTSGTGRLTNWTCGAGVLPGPEKVYDVTVAPGPPSTLRATINNPALSAIISSAANFDPANPACLSAGNPTATLWGATPGNYLLTVDGTAPGTYDLTVECSRKLVCPSPAQVIDITQATPIVGSTVNGTNNVDTYFCAKSSIGPAGQVGGYTGPEQVYEFTAQPNKVLSFIFNTTNPDLRMLILSDCYEGSCVMEGGCGDQLQPGNYRLVIDGFNGASGDYVLTPVLLPPINYLHWYDCPECNAGGCGQTTDTPRAKTWSFNSGEFCGTGCDFAMFAVVECGTEFHMPFWDVETGHIQIFDVLNQQYMNLTATNNIPANPGIPRQCLVFEQGTLVQWEDNTCTQIPCPIIGNCGGGADCRTTDVVMDVSFLGTPTVCGIFRVDFLDWGGFAWDAYANCNADRSEQYYIYPDLCSALAGYRPLPEIGVSSVTLDRTQCSSNIISGTITVENIGCGPAANIEIVVEQAPPSPLPNPKVLTVTVASGQQSILPFTYNLTDPLASLVFKVDPGSKVAECSENIGSSVSCGTATVLQRAFPSVGCNVTCNNVVPPRIGNSLLGKKSVNDAIFSWAPLTGVDLSVYRIYKDADRRLCISAGLPVPGCPGTTRTQLLDVTPPATTGTDLLALSLTPFPVAYYQVIGVSCLGDLEGPY